MKMVKFFTSLRHDGSLSNGETFLLWAISRLLEIHRTPDEWGLYMRKLEENIYTTYLDMVFHMYDTTCLKLYRCFHLVDSYDLEKRIVGMGATSDCMQLASLVTKFLLHGEMSPEARHWLLEKISTRLSPEELSDLADFPDLESESENSTQGNETKSHNPTETLEEEDPSTDGENAEVSDDITTPLLQNESRSPTETLEEEPSSDTESVDSSEEIMNSIRENPEEYLSTDDENAEAWGSAEPASPENAQAWGSAASQEEHQSWDSEFEVL